MVEICLALPRDYDVEIIPNDLLSTVPPERTNYFSQRAGVTSSLVVSVTPLEGKAWFGAFAVDYGVPPAVSRVLSSPLPGWICVVAGGFGYLVDAADPKRYRSLSLFPITSIVQLPSINALAFSDFTDVRAINKDGQIWATERLASDDVQLLSVRDDCILGTGWDAATQQAHPFKIRLNDGTVLR